MGFKRVPAAVACAIGLVIWFVIPVPQGVAPNAWHLLALFVATIAAIIGKVMPIGALSILAIALVALTGVTSDKPVDAINDALSSFASPLIWLIGVAIMISRALIKTGLGARIAYGFVAIFGKRTFGAPALPFALLMATASNIMMTLTHYATGTSPVIFGPHFGLQPR
jgi:DASS family divalent anion:Na+ symporter